MCGIVGYIGTRPAAPLLLDGLAKLEYRGYDSAGIALSCNGHLSITKCAGRLHALSRQVQTENHTETIGIGHTRWATHGKPTDTNAHPHRSEHGRFAVVHNGIIENFSALKQQLQQEGVIFCSETDTEVIPHLLEKHHTNNVLATLRKTLPMLTGSFALGILRADEPDTLYAARRAAPLIVGVAEHGQFIASDIPAILPHTRRYIPLADGEIACLRKEGITIYGTDGEPLQKPIQTVTWNVEDAEKGGYEHFMLKEIMEQPQALAATLSGRVMPHKVTPDDLSLTDMYLLGLKRLVIVGCGSAYHAGMAGRYVLERLTRLSVEVEIASEFRYRSPLVDKDTLVIVISQSGETADTLAALREAKARGARVLSIVNVVGSSIAIESDDVLYTRAGPEIAVATTKAYSAQLAVLYLLALYMAQVLGTAPADELCRLRKDLLALPKMVEKVLALAPEAERLASYCISQQHAYFIGRQLDYAAALEASLKLKEISYVHAEAYAAGELKHGTIALVEKGTFVTAIACAPEVLEKTLSNVKEVSSRGAQVLLVTTEHYRSYAHEVDYLLCLPSIHPLFSASLSVIPLQVFSYYVALARGCDIDKPRNLAKSVTVE